MAEGTTSRWRRTIAVLDRMPATGRHRYVLAYVVSVMALLPAGLLTLLYLLVQDCEGLECVGEGALLYGAGLLCAGAVLFLWGPWVGLGKPWAGLTLAGSAVLVYYLAGYLLKGHSYLLALVSVVALPAATAWATTPDRTGWVRLLRIAGVTGAVVVVHALYWWRL